MDSNYILQMEDAGISLQASGKLSVIMTETDQEEQKGTIRTGSGDWKVITPYKCLEMNPRAWFWVQK